MSLTFVTLTQKPVWQLLQRVIFTIKDQALHNEVLPPEERKQMPGSETVALTHIFLTY